MNTKKTDVKSYPLDIFNLPLNEWVAMVTPYGGHPRGEDIRQEERAKYLCQTNLTIS